MKISRKKLIALAMFCLVLFSFPFLVENGDGVANIAQIAMNHTDDPSAWAKDVLTVTEVGLGALTTLGLLCGIQAVALAVPVL